MKINMKLVSTFLSVARNVSFRKAADETHLSLPAVSMQMKQLEEQVGVALFQRTTRRVELTLEGEQLMISARKAMAELEAGLSLIQRSVDIQQGRLSFACVPTVAGSRLPGVLTTFARRYPRVTVYVKELATRELLEAVRRRDVDFGISPIPERLGDLEFEPILVDEYCALLPSGYDDRGRADVSLRELSKMPLLTLSGSTVFREHLDNALRANGLEPQSNYEFTSVTTLVAMAEAGLGVAVLGRIAVPRKTPLKVVRITSPALSRTIAVVRIRGHSLSPASGRLVDLCHQLIGSTTLRSRSRSNG